MKRLILSVLAVVTLSLCTAGTVAAQSTTTKGTAPASEYDPYMPLSPEVLNAVLTDLCGQWNISMPTITQMYAADKFRIKTVEKETTFHIEAQGFGFSCVVLE